MRFLQADAHARLPLELVRIANVATSKVCNCVPLFWVNATEVSFGTLYGVELFARLGSKYQDAILVRSLRHRDNRKPWPDLVGITASTCDTVLQV